MKKSMITTLALTTVALSLSMFATAETEVLKLELPDPYFGGTPLDYFGENLEEPSYKPRPDYAVPTGTTNIAKGKTVSSSVEKPEYGELKFLTDGDKSYENKSLLGLAKGLQWVQIDLGEVSDLYALTLWHFHEGDRVYFDVVVRVADDAAFTKNVRDIYNNDHDNSSKLGKGKDKEYIETYKSRFVAIKDVKARYIRFYTNGSTHDDFNHYVEAEIFGKVAK